MNPTKLFQRIENLLKSVPPKSENARVVQAIVKVTKGNYIAKCHDLEIQGTVA